MLLLRSDKEKKTMKKQYDGIELSLIFLINEDVIRTSQNDNVEDMPEFPENPF